MCAEQKANKFSLINLQPKIVVFVLFQFLPIENKKEMISIAANLNCFLIYELLWG